MNEWLLLAVGIALTVGTGFFVAAEFALVNLDRSDLEKRRSQGERRLSQTISALRITSTHLSSAQLGITLTTLLTGYTFEPAVSRLLEPAFDALGAPEAVATTIGSVIGVLVATVFSMVLGELVPKNFALAVPTATAKLVMPFQTTFTMVFRPVVALLNNTANALIRSVGVEPQEELSGARSADELTYLIRHSATAGLLEEDEATLLDRTLRFTGHDASDVMTPRVRMTSVDADRTVADVIDLSVRTGFSRMPVVGDGPDDIVGFVHVKHAFAVEPRRWATTPVRDLLLEPTRVPETMHADVLLGLLRDEGLQIAVVTDEYGGTAGIVTLEDLVEEIVGELEDEHDRARSGFSRSGRSVSFEASWRPDELRDRTGVEVPESEDWDTVAGYIMAELEQMPELGDEVRVEAGVLRVERVDGARVARVRFVPDEPPTSGSTEPLEEAAHE